MRFACRTSRNFRALLCKDAACIAKHLVFRHWKQKFPCLRSAEFCIRVRLATYTCWGGDPFTASQAIFLRILVYKYRLEISDTLGNVGLKVREKLVEGEVDKAWHACTAPKQRLLVFR